MIPFLHKITQAISKLFHDSGAILVSVRSTCLTAEVSFRWGTFKELRTMNTFWWGGPSIPPPVQIRTVNGVGGDENGGTYNATMVVTDIGTEYGVASAVRFVVNVKVNRQVSSWKASKHLLAWNVMSLRHTSMFPHGWSCPEHIHENFQDFSGIPVHALVCVKRSMVVQRGLRLIRNSCTDLVLKELIFKKNVRITDMYV